MAKHYHIHFLPRRTWDQAPGSVPSSQSQAIPPAQVAKLVEALMQALAARGHALTQDAQARAANGQFASGSGAVPPDGSESKLIGPSPGNSVYHEQEAEKHRSAARAKGKGHADYAHHMNAARSHSNVARRVKKLEEASSHGVNRGGMMTAPLLDARAQASMHFREAKEHEAKVKTTKTTDAGEWDESKHPRAEDGKFSSQQHTAAAENHQSAAAGHEQSAKMAGAGPMTAMHQKAAQAHSEAAEAHSLAAKHIDAGTGLGEEFASQAHSKSYVAAGHSKKLEPLAGGNMVGAAHAHLKKIASDPKQPMAKRAEATEQLKQIEKSANQLAESPHAKASVSGPSTGQRDPGEKFAGAMAANKGGSGSMESQAAAANANAPAGEKPTQATAKGAKAATHQLLSSGHPFSLEELMKATGVTSKSTMMTALSDLKNPKYAGALGALQIAKREDGMFHVTTAPAGGFKAVGAASAAASPSGGGSTPSATPTAGADPVPTDPHAVVHGSHPLSDFMPNQMLTAKGNDGAQYKVLGHNAEGKVVVQHATKGSKHAMDPADLKKITSAASAKAPEGNKPPSEGGAASKPGPDGKPMGKHPELANAERRVAENPRTTGGTPGPGSANAKWKNEAGYGQPAGPNNPNPAFKKPVSQESNPSAAMLRNAPTSELQKIASAKPAISPEMKARLAKIAPKIAAQQNAPTNKNAGPTKGSTLGPDMPGKRVPPKPTPLPDNLASALLRDPKTKKVNVPAAVSAPSNTRIQPDMNQKRLVPGSPAYKRAMAAKGKK